MMTSNITVIWFQTDSTNITFYIKLGQGSIAIIHVLDIFQNLST